MKREHGAVYPSGAKSVTAPATVSGELPDNATEFYSGRVGKVMIRKSGDLPSLVHENCTAVTETLAGRLGRERQRQAVPGSTSKCHPICATLTCAEGAMLLERTITQLNIGHTTPERAIELGQLGYMQWLGALPATSGYDDEAKRAYAMAKPFASSSNAIDAFCDLLLASMRTPIEPLPLRFPTRERRGGAKARRAAF